MELIAILEALWLVVDSHFDKVIVESNSFNAVSYLGLGLDLWHEPMEAPFYLQGNQHVVLLTSNEV